MYDNSFSEFKIMKFFEQHLDADDIEIRFGAILLLPGFTSTFPTFDVIHRTIVCTTFVTD